MRLKLRENRLDWNTFRDFQEQSKLAGDRVEDKREREEFDLLYQNLPLYWQEKVVRDAQRRPEGRYWIRFGAIPGLTKECAEDLLDASNIRYKTVKEGQSGFNIQCLDERGEDQVLQLQGGTIEGHKKGGTHTHAIRDRRIIRKISEHLHSTEEAEAIRISLGGAKRVSAVDSRDTHRDSRDSPYRRTSSPAPVPAPKGTLEYRPAPVVQAPHAAPTQRYNAPNRPGPRQNAYASSYPLPEIHQSNPWYGKRKDKWVSSVNQPQNRDRNQQDRNMHHDKNVPQWKTNNDQSAGKGNQKGGKGKGKGTGTHGPGFPIPPPPPMPAIQPKVIPNCATCEAAGRMARHESFRCTFANPPQTKPIA